MKFKPSKLASEMCLGAGIEIGSAAHNPFHLNSLNVALPDPADFAFFMQAQLDQCGEIAPVHYWADADKLPFEDNRWDFVLTSHVIEHLPNPIGAIREWVRVVRDGGVVFIVCPQRDALPADKDRPITDLEHLVKDFRSNVTVDTHVLDGSEGGRRGHYHVWTPRRFMDMIQWMCSEKVCEMRPTELLDPDDKVGNGFTVVLKKVSSGVVVPSGSGNTTLILP